MTPDGREQVVEVSIEDVQYMSDDERFSVVRVSRNRFSKEAPEFVAVGDLGRVSPGETLRLSGRFQKHDRYGWRFRVQSFTPVMPSTEVGLVKYLGSGLIDGIGPGLAQRLVDEFGGETLDIICEQSGKLRQVKGIGKGRAQKIAEAVRHRRNEAESMTFLAASGSAPPRPPASSGATETTPHARSEKTPTSSPSRSSASAFAPPTASARRSASVTMTRGEPRAPSFTCSGARLTMVTSSSRLRQSERAPPVSTCPLSASTRSCPHWRFAG